VPLQRRISGLLALAACLAPLSARAEPPGTTVDAGTRRAAPPGDDGAGGPALRWHLDVSGGHFLSAFGAWQGREIGFGGAFGAGAELGFGRRFGIVADAFGARFAAGDAPLDPSLARTNSSGLLGGALGVRVHPFAELSGLSVGAGFGVVRTGAATRGDVSAELGWDFRWSGHAQLGPFVRYVQVFQPDAGAIRPEDARALFVGLHVGFDEGFPQPPPPPPKPPPPKPVEPPPPPKKEEPPPPPPPPNPCPDKPVDYRGPVDEQGCPKKLVEVIGDTIVLGDKIYFDLSSSDIETRSYPLVKAIADVILAHPEYVLVHIEGHTDDTGQAEWNPILSQWRADAVKKKLIEYGVPAERLDAKGYGYSRPLVPGKTEEARAQNRRVEFHIERRIEK
jgi:outer membrane protein OmpA-like peptidoglycan-associated protein